MIAIPGWTTCGWSAGLLHGFKMGPVAGDYTAQRVVGRDRNPELAAYVQDQVGDICRGRPDPRAPDLVE